jgi:hypothetical protein
VCIHRICGVQKLQFRSSFKKWPEKIWRVFRTSGLRVPKKLPGLNRLNIILYHYYYYIIGIQSTNVLNTSITCIESGIILQTISDGIHILDVGC